MTEGAVTTYFRHDGINFIEIATSAGSVTKLTHGHTRIDGIGSVAEMQVDGDRYLSPFPRFLARNSEKSVE